MVVAARLKQPRHVQARNKRPKQRQFGGFWRALGPSDMGLAATMWVHMSAQVPVLSPTK